MNKARPANENETTFVSLKFTPWVDRLSHAAHVKSVHIGQRRKFFKLSCMIPKLVEHSRHSPLFLKEQVRLLPGSREGSQKSNYNKHKLKINNLPGVLKTGLLEILSQVQHIAGNLSKLNLLKALILLV